MSKFIIFSCCKDFLLSSPIMKNSKILYEEEFGKRYMCYIEILKNKIIEEYNKNIDNNTAFYCLNKIKNNVEITEHCWKIYKDIKEKTTNIKDKLFLLFLNCKCENNILCESYCFDDDNKPMCLNKLDCRNFISITNGFNNLKEIIETDNTKIKKTYESFINNKIYKKPNYFDVNFNNNCSNCNKYSSNIVICSNCKFSYYCDKNCQKEDWNKHKFYCKKN